MQPNVTTRKTPALSLVLLHKHSDGTLMHPDFHYCSVIGKLNFLEKSTCPDFTYAVHQCAHSEDPKQSHADMVKRIRCYMKETQHLGITLKPDHENSFQCWVDANFTGNWRLEGASADHMTSKSQAN